MFSILLAIAGLAFLMVVHELGHFALARIFGMRVKTFSIGFGPAIWRKQPEGSETVYQVAVIPFLAYVQIAGMNPAVEEIDPNDKASYANASLLARILTIFAGPAANYLAASVLFFIALSVGGLGVITTTIDIAPEMPAAKAGMQSGDKIVQLEGAPVSDFEHVRTFVSSHAGQPVHLVVQRGTDLVPIDVVPQGAQGQGRIGVQARAGTTPISTGKAAMISLKEPPKVVAGLVVGLTRLISGKEKPEFSGPVGIVKFTAMAAKSGFAPFMQLLGSLSAYLAGFNLLPIPALDGGRLAFLGFELTTRRKVNQKFEAILHAVFLIAFLAMVTLITVFVDIRHPGP